MKIFNFSLIVQYYGWAGIQEKLWFCMDLSKEH